MKTYSVIINRREWVFPMAEDARHLFTADTHYNHANIIKYSSRPFLNEQEKIWMTKKVKFKPCFESVQNMNKTLVDRFNEVARPQDILWHLGDVAWNNKANEFFDQLNCKNIHLIWGNHDEPDISVPMQMARPKYGTNLGGPQLILPCYEKAFVIVDGQRMVLDHVPNDSWFESHKSSIHLFGHVHGVLNKRHIDNPKWALSIDVGVDSHDFYPWLLSDLNAIFAKRYPIWQAWRERMKDKEEGGMTPV